MAARMPMIATTIISSIRVKPCCFFIWELLCSLERKPSPHLQCARALMQPVCQSRRDVQDPLYGGSDRNFYLIINGVVLLGERLGSAKAAGRFEGCYESHSSDSPF